MMILNVEPMMPFLLTWLVAIPLGNTAALMSPTPLQPKFNANVNALDSLLNDLTPYAHLPLEESVTFPPRAYTSQELFELEREKIFRPGWICVGHKAQLPAKGDYVTMDILGELMVVVNNGDRVQVLSRICTHRWAPVVEQGTGSCNKFTCPFHLWSFDLTGECVATPFMDDVKDFDRSQYPLHEYRSETVGGFVYVNIDGQAEPLAPQLAEMTKFLENWDTENVEVYIDLEYDCEFNWKIAVETFMECYHHFGAHSDTFEPNFPANLTWTEDARPAFTVGHAAPRPGRQVSAFELGLPHFPNLQTVSEKQSFALFNVFPLQLVHAMPDRIFWMRLQPITADRTVVRTFALVPPITAEMPDFEQVRQEQTEMTNSINLEDIGVNLMQQIGARSGVVKPGRHHSRLEKALWQLNTYVAKKLLAME